MVSRSRMPPPSCTGMSDPTSARMALMAALFLGWTAKAPFRSTRCRRRAPASAHLRAMAAGSSPKVVDWSMSPCLRRTQWPSLRSMAGMSNMMVGRKKGPAAKARPGRVEGSGFPVQEVAVQRQTMGGAFFRVELGGENIIACDGRGKGQAVVGFARHMRRVGRPRIEAVHEVEVAVVGHAGPHGMGHAGMAHLAH